MIKWLREHKGFFTFLIVGGLLLTGATIYLVITFREYIFSQSTLAIVIFVALGFFIAFLLILSWKVLS